MGAEMEMCDGCVILRSVAERCGPLREHRVSIRVTGGRGPRDLARRAERKKKREASIRKYMEFSKRMCIARRGV